MAEKAILFDATRCTACRGCQAACKEWNENNEAFPDQANSISTNWGSYENPKDLQPTTWLKIQFQEVEHYNKVDWLFNRRACMHCSDAACVKVCPSGALYRDETYGIVALNTDLCTGCGYCQEFCPFDVPRLDGNRLFGKGKASKCAMCTQPALNRLDAGLEPACVKACPPNALQFDDRDKLVAIGKSKVAALKANGFYNANLYGERELGGLHVMYVLNDTPDKYGLPVDPQFPVMATMWQDMLQPLGWAVGGLTLFGLGLNYMVARESKKSESMTGRGEKK